MKHKELMAEVAELLEAGWREKSLSRHFGVNRNTAAKWAYAYRALGKEALLNGRHNTYTQEQKLEARVRELELELEIQKRINALIDEIERRRQSR